jgi:hypothetical protein
MTFKEILASQQVLKRGLILLFSLNVLDVITTITLLKIAQSYNIIATEVNPIMDYFISLGYVPFVLFKLGLSAFGCILCWTTMKGQSEKYMRIGTVGVLIANTFYISILFLMIIRAIIVSME